MTEKCGDRNTQNKGWFSGSDAYEQFYTTVFCLQHLWQNWNAGKQVSSLPQKNLIQCLSLNITNFFFLIDRWIWSKRTNNKKEVCKPLLKEEATHKQQGKHVVIKGPEMDKMDEQAGQSRWSGPNSDSRNNFHAENNFQKKKCANTNICQFSFNPYSVLVKPGRTSI